MGMETRGNNRYYYQKERRGARVTSTYLGSGLVAALIAEYEELRKAEELYKRSLFKREQGKLKQQAALVLGTEADVRELVKAVLLANGFHQHKRQWRKRMQQDMVPVEQLAVMAVADAQRERGIEGFKALRAAMKIEAQPAKKGGKITEKDKVIAEQEQRAAVRKALADYPCIWPELRKKLSNGQHAIIQTTCGSVDSPSGQVLEHVLKDLCSSLGYAGAPMLEQLLIEHIALAWIDLDFVQQLYAKNALGAHSLSHGSYWDRRLSGAQARYLRATEALARVRRLSMPQPLQVNIGGQQVNVAGNG